MAPEQWDGHPVPATDQYALTIMAYELLIGRPPFQGGPGQIMRQHYLTPPPTPSTLNPRLSAAIDAVLMRALAKQPEERFPTIAAFARAFGEAAQYRGDVRATLAISQAEAETGTTRSLTLPEGRQISVTVPARVSDGATLRLEGQGIPYYEGGPVGPLMLTISTSAEEHVLPPQPSSIAPTIVGLRPSHSAPSLEETQLPTAQADAPPVLEPTVPVPPPRQDALVPTVLAANTPPPPTEVARTPSSPALRSNTRVAMKPVRPKAPHRFVLLGLTALVIVALASGVAWFASHHASPTGNPTSMVQRTSTGSITEFPLPTPGGSPGDITVGPDHNLWFTEDYANKIGRISTKGVITEFPLPALPAPKSAPGEITAGSDGNLWFTELGFSNAGETNGIGKIGRISPSGRITEFPLPTQYSHPSGITAGPDGNIWFTNGDGDGVIERINPNGKITEFSLPTTFKGPTEGITAGPDGNLWFTNGNGDNNKIGRISPSGTITAFPLPKISNSSGGCCAQPIPEDITSGPDGNLWFTWSLRNTIGRISPSGRITEFPLSTQYSDLVLFQMRCLGM